MRWLAAVLLCAHAAASSGCGYALAGRGSFLPASIRTVGIPKLENRSTFFQVEDILTEQRQRVTALLEENRDVVMALRDALLAEDELLGENIVTVIEKALANRN